MSEHTEYYTPGDTSPAVPCLIGSKWLGGSEFQTILYSSHLIAFKYNPATGEEFVSPFISEFIAGNYDGRYLSDVMLEDNVIHPKDLQKAFDLRHNVKAGILDDVTLRLKTPGNEYRWFRMSMTLFESHYIGIFMDVDEAVRQEKALRYRAEVDSISGIYNRVTFLEQTKVLLSSDPDTLHFLIRFDIDRFKLVNELYSMAEGDKVLHYIGSLLHTLARPDETYGRLDNDIFCMCVKRTKSELLQLLDTLQVQGNAYPLDFQFIFSIGILEIPHYYGESITILCDHAAIAQRTVKGNYVKRFAFYSQRMSKTMEREHNIILRMEKALNEGEFKVYLQPRFDMQHRRIVGSEALVRWIPPGHEPIPPIQFIPLFEQNGFILKMDEYIWEEACKILRRWLDSGLPVHPVSINISRVHLHDLQFCDKITNLIEKYNIAPELLELELTESAYMECQQSIIPIMSTLQKRGFKFLMDDFGSGYSSLNCLKDIPINIIKMDMNFLTQAKRGPEVGFSVLKGTIRLIQSLELPLVIEGVETMEQESFLLNLGCSEAQGYYYARPMPVSEFEKLLDHKS